MKSEFVRQKFFNFFKKQQHTKVASSSLIPAQDPTLLFANAGMNQFKDLFLGNETRSYKRAVSIQKCVRAGGKHNDLDNVGFTKRHLTFFEMMGNFSFGDYFKQEAITFAWDFLTKELAIDVTHLHVSVYKTDDESYDIWHKQIGLPEDKIHRLGKKDNFWQMGDVGPCGPCSEIHIDRGASFGCDDDTFCDPACECDRYLEIWNLVFMQFDQQADGTLKELTQKGVDTGMGLERLCSVMQDVDSVFHTDLFTPIIAATEKLTNKKYDVQDAEHKAAFHVLADHVRSATFLIADGCAPSNDGRGYVLRKIIRRAALFTQKLTDSIIFPTLSQTVIDQMGQWYPEIVTQQTLIKSVLQSEIERFSANLQRGTVILNNYLSQAEKTKKISGEHAFKLYDTYGFPLELVKAAAREHGYTVDEQSYKQHMQKQKKQSGKKTTDKLAKIDLDSAISTTFTGYADHETLSIITALVHNFTSVDRVAKGEQCFVIVKESPFFIVGGGQVPDQGWLIIDEQEVVVKSVRFINNAIAAEIIAPVDLVVGSPITSRIDIKWRANAMKNHTATHLLQSALISLFGKQIKQSGSLVHPDYLRFDFTFHRNLSDDELRQVEDLVNQKIRQNIPVTIEQTTLKDATNRGVIAFFGDKYKPDNVRVVQVSDFSAELCGGTHVNATGDIGTFKITSISSLSAGHKRIVALTGPRAVELFQDTFAITKTLGTHFKIQQHEIVALVEQQHADLKDAQKNIEKLKQQLLIHQIPSLLEHAQTINNVPFLYHEQNNSSMQELRTIGNTLSQKQPGFYVLTSVNDDKLSLFAHCSDKLSDKINLKEFATWLRDTHAIRCGGRGTDIQGGGAITKNLEESIVQWLQKK